MPSPKSVTAPPPGEWLAQMAQVIDEILWVQDTRNGRILYANPAFERFWGPETAKSEGPDPILPFVLEEDRDRVKRAREGLVNAPYTLEYQVQLPGVGTRATRIARLREKAFRTRAPSG